MHKSELRSRAKDFALHLITICDTVDTRKGRGAGKRTTARMRSYPSNALKIHFNRKSKYKVGTIDV